MALPSATIITESTTLTCGAVAVYRAITGGNSMFNMFFTSARTSSNDCEVCGLNITFYAHSSLVSISYTVLSCVHTEAGMMRHPTEKISRVLNSAVRCVVLAASCCTCVNASCLFKQLHSATTRRVVAIRVF